MGFANIANDILIALIFLQICFCVVVAGEVIASDVM